MDLLPINQDSLSSEQKVCILKIEMGDGSSKVLPIMADDDAEEVVKGFAQRNQLKDSDEEVLRSKIQSSLSTICLFSSQKKHRTQERINSTSKKVRIRTEIDSIKKPAIFLKSFLADKRLSDDHIEFFNSSTKKGRKQKKGTRSIRTSSFSFALRRNRTIESSHSASRLNNLEKYYYESSTNQKKSYSYRRSRIQQSSPEYSYKPRINDLSKRIFAASKKSKIPSKNGARFEAYESERKEKLRIKKIVHKSKNMMMCTFQPSIDPISEEIAKAANNSFGEHKTSELYRKATLIDIEHERRRSNYYKKTCPFRPEISKRSREIASKAKVHSKKRCFVNSKAKYSQYSSGNLTFTALRREMNESEQFKARGETIFERLYLNKYQRRSIKRVEPCSGIENQNTNISNSHILKEKRTTQFKILFKVFDCDKDGIITNEDIANTYIPEELQKIILPLYEESRYVPIRLDIDGFVSGMQKLFKKESRNPEKNSILMNYIRKSNNAASNNPKLPSRAYH